MTKRMLIDALHAEETRVVIADENQIYDFDFVSAAKKQLKGNIYLAKITRVEPSLQAAFVEYGGGKQGFLPFSEIHADYYQIPSADRKRLMEEAERDLSSDPGYAEGGFAEARASAQEESATQETQQQSREAESYGEQPIMEAPQENPPVETGDLSSDPGFAEARALAQGEGDHPAYLTQGAIDVSVSSEEIMPPEITEETPTAEIPSEPKLDEPQTNEAQPEATAQTDLSRRSSEGAEAEGVETIPNEEDEYRPKKHVFSRRYKIQEVIRRGQIVLVQVIKEERGNKGVSLTTYLSLAGRYCVLMPNSPKDGGVSRKIASQEDRRRLKSIYTELKLAAGMSVIIRTAGMDRTRAEIKRDYDYLVKLWNQIREDTLKSNAPALIYEESDIIKRAIRDQYSSDIDELIIEGDEGYRQAKEFMKLLLASHTPKIKHYSEPTPLFYAYNIEEQLLSMHDPVVKLPSGGYIVMNPTEALISIDVNSGRATGERNIEETATKTNLQAAAEIARQLRLRDLAGLIVIDFIDMLESRNRRAIEKALKDALKADRAKIQIGRISPFGLMEMSRQRLRSSISETNMVQCPHCIGRGVIRSNESMSIQMIRAIEKEASAGVWSSLRLIAPQTVALHLLNNKRDILRAIEERYNVTVQVLVGPELTASEFNLEKMRRSDRGDNDRNRPQRRPERERPAMEAVPQEETVASTEPQQETQESPREEPFRKRGRNRRGGRDRGPRREHQPVQADANVNPQEAMVDTGNAPVEPPVPAPGQEQPNRYPPRQRGGRGRRPWRNRDERGGNKEQDNTPVRNDYEPANSDGNTLPAFATENRISVAPSRPPEPLVIPQPPLESTPRDPNAPPKKGWWKKMIELDD